MATGTLGPRADTQTIDQTWFNNIIAALSDDLVPRATSGGAPVDIPGSLGSASYRWLKAFVASGGFSVGDIKIHHSFNGAVPVGEGWMLCDGRIVSSTTYDTEHGAGHWNTFVGSSPLNGLHLPDFTARFPLGVAATTQDGSGAMAYAGNAGSTINIQHTHTHASHVHRTLAVGDASNIDKVYDSNGNLVTIGDLSAGATFGVRGGAGFHTGQAGSGGGHPDWFSSTETSTEAAQLSTTQNIQPDSVQVQYYIRIIT